jgi:hypothetical protein
MEENKEFLQEFVESFSRVHESKSKGVRTFANGISSRTQEVRDLAVHLHNLTCPETDHFNDCTFNAEKWHTSDELAYAKSHYETQAERLYMILGGQREVKDFLHKLSLVSPKLLFDLVRAE